MTLGQVGVSVPPVAGPHVRLPARIASRPRPEDWGLDDLMTLPEAAALYWPEGPVTVATLRTSIRRGQLRVARLGRRFLTSRRAIEEMQRGEVRFLAAGDVGGR